MTDSRLPGRWLTDVRFEQLSDRAWRTFCGALMWSNEQGTNGVIPTPAMKYLHPLGVDSETRKELLQAGLWRPGEKGGVVVPEWSSTIGQSDAGELAAKREANRERQRAHRAKKRPTSEHVTRDVTRDVTRESLGKDRTGQDRTGQDYGEASGLDEATGEIVDWPTAVPGDPDVWTSPDAPGRVIGKGAA